MVDGDGSLWYLLKISFYTVSLQSFVKTGIQTYLNNFLSYECYSVLLKQIQAGLATLGFRSLIRMFEAQVQLIHASESKREDFHNHSTQSCIRKAVSLQCLFVCGHRPKTKELVLELLFFSICLLSSLKGV